jgi:hypothetical protein
VVVELRVLDRLGDLAGDRHEQVDLGLPVRPRLPGSDVQRALETVLEEDRDGEDRLILLLAEVRKALEAGVKMRVARDHDRLPFGRGRARDSFARAHLRNACQLVDPRSARGAEDELVRALVVEVHEARVGVERLRDLRGDELEELVEIESRVDRGDRLREEPEMPSGLVHLVR